ncbi:hypothetical protein NML43_25460 [Rhodopseudomonas palustris]|uniref:hypothetical protein n=1 Tax=Rhodopseudomonas palustris TaxID=1076 RepID=UPI0020CB8887|nr:hypothetical protein [Rhodopseudomonas palustris]MCP9630453.1 hypothetical protein [Rhodopseudomonas palustris]
MTRSSCILIATAAITLIAWPAAAKDEPLKQPDLGRLTTCATLKALYPKPACGKKYTAMCSPSKMKACKTQADGPVDGKECTAWKCIKTRPDLTKQDLKLELKKQSPDPEVTKQDLAKPTKPALPQ